MKNAVTKIRIVKIENNPNIKDNNSLLLLFLIEKPKRIGRTGIIHGEIIDRIPNKKEIIGIKSIVIPHKYSISSSGPQYPSILAF